MYNATRYQPSDSTLTNIVNDYADDTNYSNEAHHEQAVQIAYAILSRAHHPWLQEGIREVVAAHLGLVINEAFHASFNQAVELTHRVKDRADPCFMNLIEMEMTRAQYRASFIRPTAPLIAGQSISLSLWNRVVQG
jgi:hypothetical protein